MSDKKFKLKGDVTVGGREFLSTECLADATGFAKKTLEIHRSKRIGCPFLKIAGRALYDVEDAQSWLGSLYIKTAV